MGKYKIFIKSLWNINRKWKVNCLCCTLWLKKYQAPLGDIVPPKRIVPSKISKKLGLQKIYHFKILQSSVISQGFIPWLMRYDYQWSKQAIKKYTKKSLHIESGPEMFSSKHNWVFSKNIAHSLHCGIQSFSKRSTPLFLAKSPLLNMQTVQAFLFRQSPLYINFFKPPTLKIGFFSEPRKSFILNPIISFKSN